MNKNIKKYAVGAGLLACAAMAGIGAYFTGTDTASDAYTIGSIEIENLFEATAAGNTDLTPLQEIDYSSAKIKNVGINDAFVFMTVDIPVADVYVADLDGKTEADHSVKELFVLDTDANMGAGWVELGSAEAITNEGGQTVAMRHVYAYANESNVLTELAPEAETPESIFSVMKFINVADTKADGSAVETEYNIEGRDDLAVEMVAYGIQTQNVKTDVAFAGDNEDGSTDAAVVWEVVKNAFAIENTK